MTTPALHTLHIGINTYAEPAAPELPGAAEDAESWREYASNHLMVPDEHTQLLTGSAATREAIYVALTTVRDHLASSEDATAFITFSGHGCNLAAEGGDDGADVNATAAICPTDAVGGDHTTFLSLKELDHVLGDGAARATFVIDACYSSMGDGGSRAFPGSHDAGHHHAAKSRMILAARPWQQAWELELHGRWRGALSFAMHTLLEQWSVKRDGGKIWVNVAHDDLLFRTQELLTTLGINQKPVLLAPSKVGLVPFLRSGTELANGDTVPFPDAHRRAAQVGFGAGPDKYRFYLLHALRTTGAPVLLARILVTGSSVSSSAPWDNSTVQAKTEYWFPVAVEQSELRASGVWKVNGYKLGYHSSDDLSDVANCPIQSTSASFTKPSTAAFTTITTPWNNSPPSMGSFYNGSAAVGDIQGLAVKVQPSGSNYVLNGVQFQATQAQPSIIYGGSQSWGQSFLIDKSTSNFSPTYHLVEGS